MNLFDKFVAKYGRLPTEVDPDYLEMLRMSKYYIVDAPTLKPGKCANCGASKPDGRKYLHFGLEFDWYGVVYLCLTCIEDIAKNSGILDKYIAEVKVLQELIKNNVDLSEKGEELHKKFVKTLEEFKEFYGDLGLLAPYTSSSTNLSTTLGVDSPAPEQNTSSKPATSASKRATQSASGPGRKSLPSLTDLTNP